MPNGWILLALSVFFATPVTASVKFSAEAQSFWKKPPSPAEQKSAELSLDIQEKGKLSSVWRWRLEPLVRWQSNTNVAETNPEWNSRDSFLEFKSNELSIQIGSMMKAWEGTDGLNPMDIATMKNNTHPLRSMNLGSWGLWAQNSWESLTIEAFLIPNQTKSTLPGSKSAWWPRETQLPLEKDNSELRLPENPEYEILSRETRHSAFQNNFGARAKLQFEKIDLALAHFNGAAQTPTLQPLPAGDAIQVTPKEIVQLRNPIQIRPIDDRRKSWALGANWQLDDWILRWAGRSDEATDSNQTTITSTWQTVTGLEKTVNFKTTTWIFIFQYALGKQSNQDTTAMSTQKIFERALLFGTRASLSDELSLQSSAVGSLSSNSTILSLELERRLGEQVSVRAGIDQLSGPPDSLIGIWKNQSGAHVAVDWRLD